MTPDQKRRAFKRKQFTAVTTAQRHLFASVYGIESVQPHSHSGGKASLNIREVEAVCDTPLKWKIVCYAICRDSTGNDYLKGTSITLTEPVKQSAINKSLSVFHYDWMKADVNMNHLLTLAWIATTGPEPSDSVAVKIFSKMGAWSDFDLVEQLPDGGYVTVPKEVV